MDEESASFKVPAEKRKEKNSEKGSKLKAFRISQEPAKDKGDSDGASDDLSADDSFVFSYGEAEFSGPVEYGARTESGYSLERVKKI